MRPLIAMFAIALSFSAAAADWGRHADAQAGYAVAVPPFHAAAGAGSFRADDGRSSLRAWAGHVAQESFEAEALAAIASAAESGWAIGSERVTPSWAAWSGRRNGMLIEARMIPLCGGSRYAAVAFEFAERDIGTLAAVAARVTGSLAETGSGC